MRHLTWIRLIKAGFKLRNFIDITGNHFFTVIYADDNNLKITAEKVFLKKALSHEFTDLFSFEPVDSLYRPLRHF